MKRLFVLVAITTATLFAQGGAASADELMKQVFAALTQKDTAALQQLSISQDEFKQFVWPSITAAPTGMNAEKFYKMYSASSSIGIEDSLKQYSGRKIEVLKVTFDPPRRQAKNYRLLPGAIVSVRDESGQEKTIHMLGGVLERDGHY